MSADRQTFDIGVDIGGTFTDVVCRGGDGSIRLTKIPTTRQNPSVGVGAAIKLMQREWGVPPDAIARFVHGTTVATNAVIEAKGARIGLIATEGFKDVLEIGRQMRHAMYDLVLEPEAPAFLAPGARRQEVRERIGPVGEVLVPLDEASVERAVRALQQAGVEAIAVSLLFSFLNPAHERRIGGIIARQRPVRLFLSGPAAGVMGGVEIGKAIGAGDLVTVDIGGTSCDIALVSGGEPLIRAE